MKTANFIKVLIDLVAFKQRHKDCLCFIHSAQGNSQAVRLLHCLEHKETHIIYFGKGKGHGEAKGRRSTVGDG